MIKIQSHTIGAIATNCYFLINENTREVLIVDPAEQADQITDKIQRQQLIPRGILLTHGHADHIMAVNDLQQRFEIPVCVHEAEKEIVEQPNYNLSTAIFNIPMVIKADKFLKDGQILDLAGMQWKVLFTPGHTQGGCCYYNEEEKILISGDTLFQGSIGRTDLMSGNMPTLVRSIREKLTVLPDDVRVYPGHGDMTTIEEERKYNPYLGA